ncbi:MAG: DUF3343 domain-containing protein [Pontiellaceae bacterium]|jgi:hypothetical protein|nr:DUF3343 domain-containing protein [Pontiellaceae bacterium]
MKQILVFESTHAVLKAEKWLKANSVPYEILPTPRHISSDCGMAIRLEQTEGVSIPDLLLQSGIKAAMHPQENCCEF